MNPPVHILELLEHQSERYPHKEAFIFIKNQEGTREKITFRELLNKCKERASYLQNQTIIRRKERVVILQQPGIDYVISFLSCVIAGVIPVPVYPLGAKSMHRLQHILHDAAPAVILCDFPVEELKSKSETEVASRGDNLRFVRSKWVNTHDIKGDKENFQSLNIKGDDIAFIQYTSGSTSLPKGVMVSHKNLLSNAELANRLFHFVPECYMVSWLPPYHDMGLIGGIIQPIFSGMTSVLMSTTSFLKSPLLWLSAISSCSPPANAFTVSGAPNFAFDYCVSRIKKDEVKKLDLRSWKIAYTGSEPVQAISLERFSSHFSEASFSKNAFYPVYGLAEATLLVSAGIPFTGPTIKNFDQDQLNSGKISEIISLQSGTPHVRLVACGQFPKEQKVVIVNPVTKEEIADGVGEIWVAGNSVTNGYYNNELLTSQNFHHTLKQYPDVQFLRTGDLGFLYKKDVYIKGRIKDVMIIRGKNIYPEDLEIVVSQAHELIKANAICVFSLDDNSDRIVIVSELKVRSVSGYLFREICSAIKKAISEQLHLKVFDIVFTDGSGISKTTSGKLQRHKIKDDYLKETLKQNFSLREGHNSK